MWERGADMVLAAHYTPVKCGVATQGQIDFYDDPQLISPAADAVAAFLRREVKGPT